jgi:hypothetical protein
MATTIQIRRDTSANWTTANSVLASGEFGFETNTGKIKIGDGTTAWNSMAYISDPAGATKLGFISVTQAVDLDAMEAQGDNLVTLSGVASNAVNLGTFTGAVIPDNSTVKGALQALETEIGTLASGMTFSGDWDASAGTFPSGSQLGSFYVVSVGGTVDGIAFAVNDKLLARVDSASTTTFAANWVKIDDTESVVSVAGQTGAVVLDTADVSEDPSNLYFTQARVLTAPITGFAAAAGVIVATDTVLQAINKLQGNITDGDALGVLKATLTTKGDIYAATGAGAVTRLAVGTDGQFLVADSTAATGLKYSSLVDGGTA